MNKLSAPLHASLSDACTHYLDAGDSLVAEWRSVPTDKAAARAAKLKEALSGSGPWVEAEAEALGVPVSRVCETIIHKAEAKETQQVKWEAARIRYRERVRKAKSPSEMYALLVELRKSK